MDCGIPRFAGNGKIRRTNAQTGMPQPEDRVAVDAQAIMAFAFVKHAVAASHIAHNQPACFVEFNDHVIRRGMQVIQDEVVVVTTTDTNGQRFHALAMAYFAIAGQHFDKEWRFHGLTSLPDCSRKMREMRRPFS